MNINNFIIVLLTLRRRKKNKIPLMTLPLLYIASLFSIFTTFICLLWIKPSFIEEECQRKVHRYLRIVRGIHLLNLFLYGLVLGLYLACENLYQPTWLTILSSLTVAIVFILFWVFLDKKIRLVKSRLNVPSTSPSTSPRKKDL